MTDKVDDVAAEHIGWGLKNPPARRKRDGDDDSDDSDLTDDTIFLAVKAKGNNGHHCWSQASQRITSSHSCCPFSGVPTSCHTRLPPEFEGFCFNDKDKLPIVETEDRKEKRTSELPNQLRHWTVKVTKRHSFCKIFCGTSQRNWHMTSAVTTQRLVRQGRQKCAGPLHRSRTFGTMCACPLDIPNLVADEESLKVGTMFRIINACFLREFINKAWKQNNRKVCKDHEGIVCAKKNPTRELWRELSCQEQ